MYVYEYEHIPIYVALTPEKFECPVLYATWLWEATRWHRIV